jgi:hypothetical protein
MQLQSMFAPGSVSEHDPKDHSNGGPCNYAKDGNAGDGGRPSNQHKTGNSHTQSPQNDANAHGVLQIGSALPLSPMATDVHHETVTFQSGKDRITPFGRKADATNAGHK